MEATKTLKLFGPLYSPDINTILITCGYTKASIEHVILSHQEPEKVRELLKKPLFKNKIPILQDKEDYLVGVATIVRYLAANAADCDIYPSKDKLNQSRIDSWIDFASAEVEETLRVILDAAFGWTKLEETKKEQVNEKLGDYLSKIEAQLKVTKFLTGEKVTLADIYVGVPILEAYRVAIPVETQKKFGQLTKWLKRLAKETAFQRHLGTNIKFCEEAFTA
jgi:glutathione S-transferase